MVNKQVITKDVDTSACKFFRNNICASPINSNCKLCNEISEKMCYYKQLKRKEQECKALRKDIKDIANLLDLDTGEEYNFGNIELEIKQLKAKEQECERLKEENKEIRKYQYEQDFLQQQLDQLKSKDEELKKQVNDLLHKPEIQDKILWKIDNEALLCSKDAWIYKLEKTLAEIEELMKIEIECKTYEIENDCFNKTRCKALKEHIDFTNEILRKISEVKNG